jgi:hypothetical protein
MKLTKQVFGRQFIHFCTSPTFDVFTFACRPEKENRGTTGLGLWLGVTYPLRIRVMGKGYG